jgi:membrane-associated protein
LGPKIFNRDDSFFFKKQHLVRTKEFYDKYGAKTIVIARFVPIVRTFAPFVAGIGQMPYRRFVIFNVVGAVAWVMIFLLAGYFFGNIPVVKRNFTIVIFAIIFISILPPVFEWWRARRLKTVS